MALHPNRSRLMPQPALHLLLARQTLDRWRARSFTPFDTGDSASINAFLHGSLAPDMGNFPGGSSALAHAVHTHRTGAVQRALFRRVRTDAERAFAYGWLTHVIADALIHPLINSDAARRSGDGIAHIREHVRVEVGIDIRFCWQNPMLDGLRLEPAFDRTGYQFLADCLNDVAGADVTPAHLARMERGLVMFSHGALHFATTVGQRLCWEKDDTDVPLGSALIWHTALRLSPRNSIINAYLSPYLPDYDLVGRTRQAMSTFEVMVDELAANEAGPLPDYNLEDGSVTEHEERNVA